MIDEFFAGLDEMRAYLDRNVQAPPQRRGRLAKIVTELPRQVSRPDFERWFFSRVAAAVGAERACFGTEGIELPEARTYLELTGVDDLDPATVELLRALGETAAVVMD